MMVFDLDPGPPADIVQCSQVGLWLRDLLDGHGLKSYPKTSGSKGLQLYVPLNTPVTYEETKPLAKDLAEALERAEPDLVVAKMADELGVHPFDMLHSVVKYGKNLFGDSDEGGK